MFEKTVTLFICEHCGRESTDRKDIEHCEKELPEAPAVQPGQEVKLDAIGLKSGQPDFVRAVVEDVVLMPLPDFSWGHEWMLVLDRDVHLEEVWGESEEVCPYWQSIVNAAFVIDESTMEPGWNDLTEEESRAH